MSEPTRRQREQMEREEAIVSKAEELFCLNGFEKVSMDDLAKKAEFTKRTIYRYFTCKEDLFFAVALRGYKRLYELIKSRSFKGSTGLEKIQQSYYAYYEFFCKYPQLLLMINMTGVVKSASSDIDIPYRKKYMDFDRHVFEGLIELFIEGKSDGSIHADIEISQLAYSFIFIATGFFQMLSMSGNTYTQHFKLDKDVFVKSAIDMLLDSLKR